MELIIINVSVIIYMILGGRIELGAIFIYYLVFRVCERVIELIILVLIIWYYGDGYCNLFKLSKF